MQSSLEDRGFGVDKPYIDLTPEGGWGQPVVDFIGESAWVAIDEFVKRRANGACELCGASPVAQGFMGKRAHLFCTEPRFAYDETNKVATLKRLVNVCHQCKNAIHFCQTALKTKQLQTGRGPLFEAVARLSKFHNLTESQVYDWARKELSIWERRRAMGFPQRFDFWIIMDGTNRLWGK